MAESLVQLELSSSEALLLFEFLSRYSDTAELKIQDQAEQRVLWDLRSSLEKVLVEPFSKDYGSLLEKAWEITRDSLD